MYMAARDENRAKEVIERLDEEGRAPGLWKVIWHDLDLNDPRSARESAEHFISRERKLDILVNNPALIPAIGNVQVLNADDIEKSMAINYLGPYIFTKTILLLLESTASFDGADVRIINVGSDGYRYAKYLEYGSKETWNHLFKWYLLPSLQHYVYSKLALHLWTNHLGRRLSERRSNALVIITQPGIILSDGAIRPLYSLTYPSFWIGLVGLVMHPQTTGACTSVFTACAPRDDPEIFQGAYTYPTNIAVPRVPIALAKDRQGKLMEFTEEFLQSIGV
ncbi:NAD(P)-binding protein [Armillaria gallica]|uniref:NAD(P)-binding protein n=1 Tax=Armillaria gallica TaxID=47427 RepID=A0A2H3E9A9_ARMGA|nr:NAD(P)-binding protein [Armillaria gallica]